MRDQMKFLSLTLIFSLGIGLFFKMSLVTAWAHGEKKFKHDLEHLESKPQGMIEFDKDATKPGAEYGVPAKKDPKASAPEIKGHGMNHDMGHSGHGQHDPSAAPFFSRGQHDLGDLKKPVDAGQSLLARGRNIYLHMCVYCHGEDGNGGGTATDYLYPWPRDFRKGIFKFRSTPTGSLPQDADLYRTIVKGVPGTSMPAWGEALSPQDTWALVNLIKSFSNRFKTESPGGKIEIKPIPSTPESIEKGEKLFIQKKCNDCHGDEGKGDGRLAESLMDAWKHAVFVHDITHPRHFKAGYQAQDIYRTLSTGLDGTPMESFAHLPDADRWALVHFIRSRFQREVKQAEFETDVFSHPVDIELNTDPKSSFWDAVPTTDLILRPLSARREAVETINFASVNNGEQIAIRLRWEDQTKDGFVENRGDVYRDGVAVQIALGEVTLHTHGHNEPFFGMGNRGKPVNIWHWKAGLEETLESSEDSEYSTGGVDMDALIFGGIMSNPISKLNSTQQNTVDELNSEGFGTITPQLPEYQNVEGYGEWDDGVWTVVFVRNLSPESKWDANFVRTDPALLAFAVWDGVKEDRNGRKVISVWQRLNIISPGKTKHEGEHQTP